MDRKDEYQPPARTDRGNPRRLSRALYIGADMEIDNDWLMEAHKCYQQSFTEGLRYIPCPDCLRPNRTIFDAETIWFIYLPTANYGYVIDYACLSERVPVAIQSVILWIGWVLFFCTTMALFSLDVPIMLKMPLIIIIAICFLFIPLILINLPWMRKVRRNFTMVPIPTKFYQFLKARSGGKKPTLRIQSDAIIAKLVSGVAGLWIKNTLIEKGIEEFTKKVTSAISDDW